MNNQSKQPTPDFYGKIPPQACEIEQAVLAACLLDNEAVLNVLNILKPESFYNENNQTIFKAIYELSRDNRNVDMLSVCEKLRTYNKLEQIGGYHYVTSLTNLIGSSGYAVQHAQIVQQKYVQRELIRATTEILASAYDENADVEDLICSASSKIDDINTLVEIGDEEKPWTVVLKEVKDKAERTQILAAQGKCIGIPTPIWTLTKWTRGWQNGNVYVIAARPSMGKTALSLSIMKTAAKSGEYPCYFSLETTSTMLGARLLIGESGVDADNFQSGKMDENEWRMIDRAIGELENLNIYINDKSVISMDYIKLKCRTRKKQGKCSMILIDYLQLAKEDGKFSRENEVSEMSRKCKIMAKELNVPVILLSQLNRSCEARADKRPILSDLRESGAIEQDADMVMFINRPARYDIEKFADETSTYNAGELIIAKFKEGGIGDIKFSHNDSLTAIYDYGQVPEIVSVVPENQKLEADFNFNNNNLPY